MISFTGALKVYLALEPQDLRKSFTGLAALVSDHLKCVAGRGALYVFTNQRKTRIKLLYWDGTGQWVATNSHAPQCAVWFVFENSLSVSSSIREGP